MMYRQNFVAVIKCNGKIMREKSGGSVYLPFGSEYSILLKNKDARKVLVGVEVDGQDTLNGNRLILSGNESQELKGFMRNMSNTNKFKFIKKTKEIQKHRGDRIDDGLIRITYQFEKYQEQPITTTTWIYPSYSNKRYTYNSDWDDNSGGVYHFNDTNTVSCCSDFTKSYIPSMDEGITVKGNKIRQQYEFGNIDQVETKTYTIVLHLKGMSEHRVSVKKPLTVSTKVKCSICGRKNRSSNNCCYNCGTYLH